MATTKRILQLPTLNDNKQITGSSGKTYITTVPAKVSNFVPWTATSSSWWPTDDGGSFVDYNPTTDIKGNIIWWSSGRVNYDNTWRVVNTSVKPAVPTWWADKSVALMSAWKTWVTNNLAWGKTDNLPWVTKYAGQDQTAWGIKYWNNQAGIDLLNKSNQTPMEWAYNPTPTVATTQNPVVKRTLPKEEAPVKPDIQAMDLPTIQENIDRLTYKVNSGKSLTEDEYVTFNQLRRQATDMMKPQSLTGWLDNLMQQQQSEITTTQQTQEEQNAKDLEAFTKSQEAYKTSQIAMINQEENLSRQRMAAIFGATWQDSSTDTISNFSEMEQNYALRKEAKLAEIQAKIDLFWSQQRKDSAETIQKMKDNLYNTQIKASEYDVKNLQEINAYNQQQGKDVMKNLDDLKAMSDGIIASSTPLTEQQKEQASVIWQFLVDPDWWLNQALLESYKKTNPNLIPYALSMAVGERNKIQENKLAMQWLDADIKKAQLNKLLNPAKEYEYVKDADWNTIAVAKDNPNERINITGGGEWLWDLRGLASQFPWQARAKNNNPAWITRNGNFDNPKPWTTAYALQQAGIQYNKGTPRPWNEWGNYVTFNTIEDWLAAQRIMMSQTYGNSTVGKMLSSRVWTGEWPNYAKQVAWMAGLDVNTPISQLSDEQLSTLQMSKIKKESPWLAKLLQQQAEPKSQYKTDKDATKEITGLRKEFNALPEVKNYKQVVTSYKTIEEQAKKATPAGDLSMIFSYMKLLDPTSTVREWEFANAQNAASIPDQVRNAYNKAAQGTRLNDKQRQDFLNWAKVQLKSYEDLHNQALENYKTYITMWWNPNDIWEFGDVSWSSIKQATEKALQAGGQTQNTTGWWRRQG